MTILAAGPRVMSVLLLLIAYPLLWGPDSITKRVACGRDADGEWLCHYSSETTYGVLSYCTVMTTDYGSSSVVRPGRLAATIAATVALGVAAAALWVWGRRIRVRVRLHRVRPHEELRRVFS